MVKVRVAVPVPLALPALKVTTEVPVTVGVPVIFPVLVLTLNPVGSPVALKLVGELVAVIEYVLIAVPFVPAAVFKLVMTGFGRLTVKVRVAVPAPFALEAPIVTVELPAVVGVPVIAPEAVLTLNPAGNPSALKLVGLLLAAIV